MSSFSCACKCSSPVYSTWNLQTIYSKGTGFCLHYAQRKTTDEFWLANLSSCYSSNEAKSYLSPPHTLCFSLYFTVADDSSFRNYSFYDVR